MTQHDQDENARRIEAERDAVMMAGLRTRVGYVLEFLDEIDRNGPNRTIAETKLHALLRQRWWWK